MFPRTCAWHTWIKKLLCELDPPALVLIPDGLGHGEETAGWWRWGRCFLGKGTWKRPESKSRMRRYPEEMRRRNGGDTAGRGIGVGQETRSRLQSTRRAAKPITSILGLALSPRNPSTTTLAPPHQLRVGHTVLLCQQHALLLLSRLISDSCQLPAYSVSSFFGNCLVHGDSAMSTHLCGPISDGMAVEQGPEPRLR
jgi:hypothetical protein